MTAHRVAWLLVILVALVVGDLQTGIADDATAAGGGQSLVVYFGTYTGGKSKGIYAGRLDTATGRLGSIELAAKLTNPSFLAIHPNHRSLYAVGEVGQFKGERAGAVTAFAIDPKTRKLTLLNQQASGGTGPCHVSVDPGGKCALVANYGGGSVACLPIGDDGRLSEATSVIQHRGKSVNPGRQEGPHAHSINPDAADRFAFAPDLGLDKVLIYRLDAAEGKLTPNGPAFAATAPGAGPRHFAFHPNGRYAYVINELNSTVTAFTYDAKTGSLRTIQSVSTLPEGFHGTNYPADIHVHPSGKFVYGSNRGHDSIAIFAVDPDSGKLSPIGHESTRGKNPRNFNLDPTGRWLLAANQDTDNVAVFAVEGSGKLRPVGEPAQVGKPVCVVMTP